MASNLIDLTESLADRMNLSHNRIDDNEISVVLHGGKADYDLTVMLKQEYDIIYFSCDIDIPVTEEKYNNIIDAIVKANERIWIGHFDFISIDNRIVYSITIPFVSSFLMDELIIESTIKLILDECDRFYHYFLMIMSDGNLPESTIDALFLEAVGEA